MKRVGSKFLIAGLILLFAPLFGYTYGSETAGVTSGLGIIGIVIGIIMLSISKNDDDNDVTKDGETTDEINNNCFKLNEIDKNILSYSQSIGDFGEKLQEQLYEMTVKAYEVVDKNRKVKRYFEIKNAQEYMYAIDALECSVVVADGVQNDELVILLTSFCVKYYTELAIEFNNNEAKETILKYIHFLKSVGLAFDNKGVK